MTGEGGVKPGKEFEDQTALNNKDDEQDLFPVFYFQ